MNLNLSAPFILRPVMTTFVMLTIIIAGTAAYMTLPVTDLPTVQHPHIEVTASYSGAAPETILNRVTIPIEKELTHVKGVKEMTSNSSPGYSKISLSFDLSKNIDEAARDVQAALNRAERSLPNDMTSRPSYSLQEDGQEPIIYLLLTSDSISMSELRRYADTYVVPRLNKIEGVAQVRIFGPGQSLWLRVNPELLAARNIGFNEVITTIKSHTTQSPLGTIQTNGKRLSLEIQDAINNSKDLENLQIGNTAVRIKDIGTISKKSLNEQDVHFVSQEKTSVAVILAVQKITDANTVAISKEFHRVVDNLKKELPPSVELNLWFDKARWIEESLLDVQWTLIIAFILVVLVIYFSLGRAAESLITSAVLPLSLLGTFAIIFMANFSLDLLSLLALTLAVGFVVDDAIVVLENIVRYHEKGESAITASLAGSKQICFTILSMTLSLVAVFIPLLFMPGINGRLFREFSLTLAAAILVSGFISLTLTPMLCSRFLSSHREKNSVQRKIESINDRIVNLYSKTLVPCFKYRKSIILSACLSIGMAALLFSKLPVNLIPPEDRGFVFAYINMPSGLSPDQINIKQNQLETIIKSNPHVEGFLSIYQDSFLMFITRLHPAGSRPPQEHVISDLQEKINTIPGLYAHLEPYQLINLDVDFGSAGKYKLEVQGADFADVFKETRRLTTAMQAEPKFSYVKNSLQNDSPVLAMEINREKAHRLGFDKREIQEFLQHAYGQGPAGSIQKGARRDQIFLELLPEFQNHADAPSQLYLTNSDGDLIPLKSIVTWTEKMGSPNLRQREQLPSATIRFALNEDVSPSEGLKRAEEIAQATLPANISGVLTGSAKTISSTIYTTLLLLLAAALVMYIVLGILYENFIHPLTILSSIPLACLGGVLTLFLFDEPISIFSAVGFLLLIGIVKKNGIMMVDYAIEAQAQGKSPQDAIHEACLVRFRPITMTTVAAIMGALPIAIGLGDGAEMRRGLGLVIVGGLLFSQLLTLYVTPILYLAFNKLATGNWKRTKTP